MTQEADETLLEAIKRRDERYLDWIAGGHHWMDFKDTEAAADRNHLLRIIHEMSKSLADIESVKLLVAVAVDSAVEIIEDDNSNGVGDRSYALRQALRPFGVILDPPDHIDEMNNV